MLSHVLAVVTPQSFKKAIMAFRLLYDDDDGLKLHE